MQAFSNYFVKVTKQDAIVHEPAGALIADAECATAAYSESTKAAMASLAECKHHFKVRVTITLLLHGFLCMHLH